MPLKPKGGGVTVLPVIGPSDGGKVLGAKLDRSGTEWVDAPSGGGVSIGMVIALGGD